MWEQLSTLTEKDAQNIIVLVKSPCQLSLLLSFLYWHPDLCACPSINTLVSKFRSGNSSGHVAFWRCVQKMTHTIFRRRVYIMKQAIFQKEKEKNTFFLLAWVLKIIIGLYFLILWWKWPLLACVGPHFGLAPDIFPPLWAALKQSAFCNHDTHKSQPTNTLTAYSLIYWKINKKFTFDQINVKSIFKKKKKT